MSEEASGTRQWSSLLHEYLVDILGGLVPGILLAVGSAWSLLLPLRELRNSLAAPSSKDPLLQLLEALRGWQALPATPFFFAFTGVALMTYVAGHVYYRRDPKTPDQASFRLLERRKVEELALRRARFPVQDAAPREAAGRHGALARGLLRIWYRQRLRVGDPRRLLRYLDDHAELLLYLRNDLGSASAERCEFPYPTFRQYLEKRGLDYLTSMVGWKQDGESDTRSKVWVNVLKIRLLIHHPHRCRQIVRNEAHVRLASGTWYVAGTLRRLALVGLGLVAVRVALAATSAQQGWRLDWQAISHAPGEHFWTLLSPLSVLLVAWYLRSKIDGFFHYQRMREVNWVLETAFAAFRDAPERLQPPFRFPSSASLDRR